MTRFLTTQLGLMSALLIIGAVWGLTLPLMKIAVSTGYDAFGLIFWQLVFSLIYFCLVSVIQWRASPLKLTKSHGIVFLAIAISGTLAPATASYIAVGHIPAGIYAITISLVPMFALPIAIVLRLEGLELRRACGVALGLCAIIVLVAPSTSLPDASKTVFVLIACLASLCYAIEDNFVGKFTLRGLTPVQALAGASALGLVIITPVAFGTGQWISLNRVWGAPEWAILSMGLLHGFAYTGYVWLVGRAGPVFAAQVAYLVTGFGVFWSIVILREIYSGWVWLALVLMMIGLFLVQPKDNHTP